MWLPTANRPWSSPCATRSSTTLPPPPSASAASTNARSTRWNRSTISWWSASPSLVAPKIVSPRRRLPLLLIELASKLRSQKKHSFKQLEGPLPAFLQTAAETTLSLSAVPDRAGKLLHERGCVELRILLRSRQDLGFVDVVGHHREIPPSRHPSAHHFGYHPMALAQQRLARTEGKFVDRRQREAVRTVPRRETARWQRILRVKVVQRLEVLRERVGCGHRQTMLVALLHGNLHGVVPDFAHIVDRKS